MPNLDGGHYFLTVLAPIIAGGIVDDGDLKSSPVHAVRAALATLPTALQSPASEAIGLNSPFARDGRTHFARFVVLDDPFYNGRDPSDSLVGAIRKTNLLDPQPVDQLPCPYLIFVADFDPAPGAEEPRSYLENLWAVMPGEIEAVFRFCEGFDTVRDAAGFARFIVERQVETTMPFNDYWVGAPPFPTLKLWRLAAPLALAAILWLGIVFTLHWSWLADLLALLALLLAAAGVDYQLVKAAAARPFPAAPHSTLPDVLKALHLQHAFTSFVIDNQGADPEALRAAFDTFIANIKPGDLSGPSQPAGVVGS
jgi:hypothetical protein